MKVEPFYRMTNQIQNYPWGSVDGFSESLGIPNPEERPQAELWMGAHPKAPSRIVHAGNSVGLDEFIQRRFPSNPLPFLFKVLSAGSPLSIQAHPDLSQARHGFEAENRAGVPLDAPERNYRDPNHKPELIGALTDFTALRGFRPPGEIADYLNPLAGPALTPALSRLAAGRSGGPEGEEKALKDFFADLMDLSGGEKRQTLERALAYPEGGEAFEWVHRLATAYPGDIAALAPLYLNLVNLKPGQAMYLPAGELHAYLRGTGMEIMASSDNVLRGGLTVKHVDIPELLRVLVFRGGVPDIIEAVPRSAEERVYPTPAGEFELSEIILDGNRVERRSPSHEILLALRGEFSLAAAERRESLKNGESLYIPPSTETYSLQGEGRLFRAALPFAPQ